MTPEILYYIWAGLLLIIHLGSLILTMFQLPGNWLIALTTIGFATVIDPPEGMGLTWPLIGFVIGLAALGELIELIAGALGAAKKGASRRAMALATVGAFAGSLIGAALLSPIPVIGLLAGAIGGGALGAFTGAYLGEIWKGKTSEQATAVSTSAMIGRILGMVAKLIVGASMITIVAFNLFF